MVTVLRDSGRKLIENGHPAPTSIEVCITYILWEVFPEPASGGVLKNFAKFTEKHLFQSCCF